MGDKRKAVTIPNLINCSSRFYLSAFKSNNRTLFTEELEEYENIYTSVKPDKERPDIKLDFSKLCQLTSQTSVLSIYGSRDDNVGLRDCSHFANLLNRGRYYHHLTLIPNADRHLRDITRNDEMQKSSTEDLKSERTDPNHIVNEIIVDYLRPDNESQRFFCVSLQVHDSSGTWSKVFVTLEILEGGELAHSVPKILMNIYR